MLIKCEYIKLNEKNKCIRNLFSKQFDLIPNLLMLKTPKPFTP
jgi:hypothetical protein